MLDLVFPPRCVGCRIFDTAQPPRYLCKRCLGAIPLKRSYECVGCDVPTPHGLTCRACIRTWALDQLCAVATYSHPTIKAALHAYKYRFIPAVARPLADLMRRWLRDRTKRGLSLFAANPLVVPVPLHQRRYNWRGFNQAELLAHALAGTYQQVLRTDVLVRTKVGPQQAQTEDRNERLENVRGLFACPLPGIVRNRDILLIDDVCTTGATLNECARVLKDAGARAVAALVIAKG